MVSRWNIVAAVTHTLLALGCILIAGDFIGQMNNFMASLAGFSGAVNAGLAIAHIFKIQDALT